MRAFQFTLRELMAVVAASAVLCLLSYRTGSAVFGAPVGFAIGLLVRIRPSGILGALGGSIGLVFLVHCAPFPPSIWECGLLSFAGAWIGAVIDQIVSYSRCPHCGWLKRRTLTRCQNCLRDLSSADGAAVSQKTK
jgi:hypothetical protein